jgi:hypothetical protein
MKRGLCAFRNGDRGTARKNERANFGRKYDLPKELEDQPEKQLLSSEIFPLELWCLAYPLAETNDILQS